MNYYSRFNNVLAAAGKKASFTEIDLNNEFRSKNKFGFIMACMIIPISIIDKNDLPDLSQITKENREEFMKNWRKCKDEAVQNSPLLRSRFLSVVDEMIEYNVI